MITTVRYSIVIVPAALVENVSERDSNHGAARRHRRWRRPRRAETTTTNTMRSDGKISRRPRNTVEPDKCVRRTRQWQWQRRQRQRRASDAQQRFVAAGLLRCHWPHASAAKPDHFVWRRTRQRSHRRGCSGRVSGHYSYRVTYSGG